METFGSMGLVNSTSVECLVPFHKLSQWLSYSLIESLERSGLKVLHIDQLTGLAEYRNGGLFVDLEHSSYGTNL